MQCYVISAEDNEAILFVQCTWKMALRLWKRILESSVQLHNEFGVIFSSQQPI
ncbi:hypothetical protein PGB90_007958 [Kerria lacca]